MRKKKPRHGVIPRAKPEDRTYLDVFHESKLNASRHMQLEAQKQSGLTYECYPVFHLGPDVTYKADFCVRTPDCPWVEYTVHQKDNPFFMRRVDVPDGWAEEIKGKVRTGVGRLKTLWRKYGQVPLIILNDAGRTGLGQMWRREVVIPTAKGSSDAKTI